MIEKRVESLAREAFAVIPVRVRRKTFVHDRVNTRRVCARFSPVISLFEISQTDRVRAAILRNKISPFETICYRRARRKPLFSQFK